MPTITVVIPLSGSLGETESVSRTLDSLDANNVAVEAVAVTTGLGEGGDNDWLANAVASADHGLFMVLFPGDVCRHNALDTLAAHFRIGATEQPPSMVYADHLIRPDVSDRPAGPATSGRPDDDPDLTAIAELPSPVVLKPSPSPQYLLGKNYVANAAMYRRELAAAAPLPNEPVDALHDLALRGMTAGAIGVPKILFELTNPTADLTPSVPAVAAHLKRTGVNASVTAGAARTVQVRYDNGDDALVSVIIPTCGSSGRPWGATRTFVIDAVISMLDTSTYDDTEFVIVFDSATPQPVLSRLQRLANERLKLVEYSHPFNFSDKINVGAAAATGELLLLLNDDTQLLAADSVGTMVALAQQPGVGVVGARLLYPDGTLQHGGHTYTGQMLHSCLGWPGDSPGPFPYTPLAVTREVSGVTAAAAMVPREVFDQVGGFDIDLPINFNDVDFCLRVSNAGFRNLWTPDAVWYHFETVTRSGNVSDAEVDFIYRRWGPQLLDDPFYNRQLIRKRADWQEPPMFLLDR